MAGRVSRGCRIPLVRGGQGNWGLAGKERAGLCMCRGVSRVLRDGVAGRAEDGGGGGVSDSGVAYVATERVRLKACSCKGDGVARMAVRGDGAAGFCLGDARLAGVGLDVAGFAASRAFNDGVRVERVAVVAGGESLAVVGVGRVDGVIVWDEKVWGVARLAQPAREGLLAPTGWADQGLVELGHSGAHNGGESDSFGVRASHIANHGGVVGSLSPRRYCRGHMWSCQGKCSHNRD